MPRYMDIHKNMKGLTKEAIEGIYQGDLVFSTKESKPLRHGVKVYHYWYNETEGTLFCLADAPSKEAFAEVHRDAHGLVADEIIEVNQGP